MNLIEEIFEDAFPLIKQYAPTLASVIGGPLGSMAAGAISILGYHFGHPEGKVRELAHKILSDPLAKEKLEAIEHTHSSWLCAFTDNFDRLIGAEFNVKISYSDPK